MKKEKAAKDQELADSKAKALQEWIEQVHGGSCCSDLAADEIVQSSSKDKTSSTLG